MVFSKKFVGLLESASLLVVILARVMLPTLGSPRPHKSEITLGDVVVRAQISCSESNTVIMIPTP